VVKKNGSRADYDRDKLLASMQLALRKRPVTMEAIEAAIDRIEERLITLGEREVPSERVGELVMRELKRLDKVAYIRFASVYRNFEDVDEFSEAIREIKKPRQPRARS
jgi:transcriptional repressor NrdR